MHNNLLLSLLGTILLLALYTGACAPAPGSAISQIERSRTTPGNAIFQIAPPAGHSANLRRSR